MIIKRKERKELLKILERKAVLFINPDKPISQAEARIRDYNRALYELAAFKLMNYSLKLNEEVRRLRK